MHQASGRNKKTRPRSKPGLPGGPAQQPPSLPHSGTAMASSCPFWKGEVNPPLLTRAKPRWPCLACSPPGALLLPLPAPPTATAASRAPRVHPLPWWPALGPAPAAVQPRLGQGRGTEVGTHVVMVGRGPTPTSCHSTSLASRSPNWSHPAPTGLTLLFFSSIFWLYRVRRDAGVAEL